MQHRSEYRTTDVTSRPGVYVFRDRLRQVIYVGKAKSLRKRVSNYFQPSRAKTVDPKLRSLINSIEYFELFPVRTEAEAILLESRFVKQHNPRYNVVLRDDKRFLLVRIDVHAPYPRLSLARLRKDDDCLYFGPFPHAGILRDTIDYLTQHFGLRSCKPRIPGEADHRHCLDHIIRYCCQPCVNKLSREEYRQRVDRLISVLEGNVADVTAKLEVRMKQYAELRNFESAAKMRDMIENIRSMFAGQNRNFSRKSATTYPGLEGVLELQQLLELETSPKVIECFDIANISGQFAVGSMVCFRDGAPAKKDYRHYRIKEVCGPDDFAMMREVVKRRYQRLLSEQKRLPDLIVVDGGAGQLHAAVDTLEELSLGRQPVIGLAKKQEEIFTIQSSIPITLERHEKSLKLLQAIRDEAHRFANTFHDGLRRKRIQDSVLDEIPGIGKKRKQEILKAFGSVRNLKKYSADEVAARLPGIGSKLASEIAGRLSKVKALRRG